MQLQEESWPLNFLVHSISSRVVELPCVWLSVEVEVGQWADVRAQVLYKSTDSD